MEDLLETLIEFEKLAQGFADSQRWLDIKMRSGRYSFGLVLELTVHAIRRSYNTHSIYDKIGRLEGSDNRRSTTKPATPFTGKVLQGLWHKHHSQGCFLATNLHLEWRHDWVVDEIIAPYVGRYVDEVVEEIAHKMVIGAYERRARRGGMTGEWLIFEPEKTGNYYITLSSHNGETDEARRERVEAYHAIDKDLLMQTK